MKIALAAVGHNPKRQGAFSKALNCSEHTYWLDIAKRINKLRPEIKYFTRKNGNGYISEMKEMVDEINKTDADVVLELHFNGGQPQANGCEVLYYRDNRKAKEYAELFMEQINKEFDVKIRGEIPIYKIAVPLKNKAGEVLKYEYKYSYDRGLYGITKARATWLLLEPFFGTNEESLKFQDRDKVAKFLLNYIDSINGKEIEVQEKISNEANEIKKISDGEKLALVKLKLEEINKIMEV